MKVSVWSKLSFADGMEKTKPQGCRSLEKRALPETEAPFILVTKVYWTIRLKFAEFDVPPEVPVTVIWYVPLGVPGLPVLPLDPLLPHEDNHIAETPSAIINPRNRICRSEALRAAPVNASPTNPGRSMA
jgi:hypothetical protein